MLLGKRFTTRLRQNTLFWRFDIFYFIFIMSMKISQLSKSDCYSGVVLLAFALSFTNVAQKIYYSLYISRRFDVLYSVYISYCYAGT